MTDMNMQKNWFKNHIATFTDLGNIKIIDFRNPNDCSYYIRFLFDEDIYTLHISGDLGNLTASNYKNMTYKDFGDYIHNPSYFISKVDCHSRRIYEYNYSKAKKDLTELIKEYELDYSKYYDTLEDLLDEVFEDFNKENGLSQRGYDVLSDIDSDCWEWCGDLGKQSTGIIETYLLAFELAIEQLNNKENNNVR